MKKYLLSVIIPCLFAIQPASGQLTSQKDSYTLGDTLRGSLRPERTCFDVTFYELSVKIDTTEKSISGSNKIFYKTVQDFQTLQLDLFRNMKIANITSGGVELKYRREYNAIFVEMMELQKAGSSGELTVNYYGKPNIAKRAPWDGGFTWSYDKNGNNWIAVTCEGIGASLWWPCKDYLGDEPDSMRISCTVPENLKCISNGREEQQIVNSDHTISYNWFVSYPINSYNVTLNIGGYTMFQEEYTAEDKSVLSLDYYVMPYNLEKARMQFEQVKPMLKCYEKYLGKYPFWNDGYSLVETPYLGMEHQGAIAYGNKYLTGYAGTDFSRIGLDFDYIIIHESAHEWWGNSVSCRDIADMWIHEGFATYTESIYAECLFGNDTAIKYINAKKSRIGNKSPIVGKYGVNEEGDGDMYAKGSLFLNTLRHIIDDDSHWWAMIKGMCDTTFKMKNIGYEDVVQYFNTASGTDLSAIFEQYLKYPHIPVFEYQLKKQKKREFKLTYRWQSDVKNFKMPVYISTSENPRLRIDATNEFQSITIPLKKEALFKVNEDLMYIEVREGK